MTWGGPRRYMFPESLSKRTFYLEKQVEQLSSLKHNLSQITFVVPNYEQQPKEYTDFLNSLPSKIRETPVVVEHRPNVGMSYGGFNHCYVKWRQEFEYYFFLEDDYFFVKDDFDKIFIEEIEQYPNCGYLCMNKGNGGGVYKMHAAVPMGILRSAACEVVFSKYGELPHSKNPTDYTANEAGQVAFGHSFLECGFELRDWEHRFRCWLSMLGRVCCIYQHNKEDIIVPTQVLINGYHESSP